MNSAHENNRKLTKDPEHRKRSGLPTLNTSLKIAFDGKRAANNKTGLGNYSRSLIEQLATRFPENSYLIYTPKADAALLSGALFAKKNVSIHFPSKKANVTWRSFGILKQLLKDGVNLFHGLSHEIPFGLRKAGIKSIVTIHDLIFLVRPQSYHLFDRLIYTIKSKYACRKADRIIAISEQTKKDIISFYKIDPEKIEVIYQSCDDQFKVLKPLSAQALIRQKYKLHFPYILSVGTIEERKNLLLLIHALPRLSVPVKLVVIGKETSYSRQVKKDIETLGLTSTVVFLKDVPFADLPAIYQMATAFVYPSRYEGFGIPVIEALYSKVPVIAATGSCLEEAGGPDSCYVSPDDPDALANALNHILDHPEVAAMMVEKGYAYVERFDTENVTRQLMACYRNTLAL